MQPILELLEIIIANPILWVCIVLIVLPPKYDPAIRIKEWLDGR